MSGGYFVSKKITFEEVIAAVRRLKGEG